MVKHTLEEVSTWSHSKLLEYYLRPTPLEITPEYTRVAARCAAMNDRDLVNFLGPSPIPRPDRSDFDASVAINVLCERARGAGYASPLDYIRSRPPDG
jgi:hypothetical protein